MNNLSPVKLRPSYKDYIWGGNKLKSIFNKKTELGKVAESWELSARGDGECFIAEGPYSHLPFSEYLSQVGYEVLGSKAKACTDFPLLIKLIDATDKLSVQVHPDDEYALIHEGEYGKTEMWYVLDCDENSYIYYGFSEAVTRKEFENAIKNNTVTDLLNKVYVKKGDAFLIKAGTPHAIGAGILICEIQQNSNITYRIYDYNRCGKDGNLRPLHIAKALDVLNFSPTQASVVDGDENDVVLAACDYFTVRRIKVCDKTSLKTNQSSFYSLIITDGSGVLEFSGGSLSFNKGDSIFIPSQDECFTIAGSCEIILSSL